MFLKEKFTSDVAKKRKLSGYSMTTTSKFIGIGKTTYCRIENGQSNFDILTFEKVLRWLKSEANDYFLSDY